MCILFSKKRTKNTNQIKENREWKKKKFKALKAKKKGGGNKEGYLLIEKDLKEKFEQRERKNVSAYSYLHVYASASEA